MEAITIEPDVVIVYTKVLINGKFIESSLKINKNDFKKLGELLGNKALDNITKKLYDKTTENIKLALNDNL